MRKRYAYYNEIEPFCVAWLRELVRRGIILDGEVDCRSISEVKGAEIRSFKQCHFFAGIGGWAKALALAAYPKNEEVWTGSCPCQPFSVGGSHQGDEDDRHLWPEWFRLIRECHPSVIFGEQVSPAINQGWLDDVFVPLESIGYSCGAVDFPACSVGAPHIRQRLYFVAYRNRPRLERAPAQSATSRRGGRLVNSGLSCQPVAGFWSDAEWLTCRDGKARPTEPSTKPLVNGTTQRVGRLRAYGNAIVAPQAAAFVQAFRELNGVDESFRELLSQHTVRRSFAQWIAGDNASALIAPVGRRK